MYVMRAFQSDGLHLMCLYLCVCGWSFRQLCIIRKHTRTHLALSMHVQWMILPVSSTCFGVCMCTKHAWMLFNIWIVVFGCVLLARRLGCPIFFFFCKFSSVYFILFTFHDHPSDDWLRERRQTAIRLWIHTTKNTNIFERILTADRFSVHCPSPPVNSKRAINYSRLTRSTMTDARARELQRRPGQTDQMWKRKDAYGTHVTRVRTH